MPNDYLKNKIKKYELGKYIVLSFLIVCAFFAGRYFFFINNLFNIVVGLVLGTVGASVLLAIEYYINKQISYKKGLDLEIQIERKLSNLSIEYDSHVETDYGDLDFLIIKNVLYYGVEAKNWPGIVKFENGLLNINGFDNTDILSALLKHCKLVRDLKFGENSGKFIKPMLVFGYKTVVSIPQNKIKFNNIEIIVTTIKDFDRYIR